jgi:hypothetical protein
MNGWIHISISNVDFKCPYCQEQYSDKEDKYLNRIQRGKQGYTKIKCRRCGDKFGMAYDSRCNAVSFPFQKLYSE